MIVHVAAVGGRRRGMRLALALVVAAGTLLTGCGETEPTPTGSAPLVRRLTESEYRASIADIFGANVPIAARFEDGLRIEGLTEVGTSEAGVSPFSVEQYSDAATGIASAVLDAENRERTVPCKPQSADAFDRACAQAFVQKYGTRLFRRPLSADQVQRYVGMAETGFDKLGNFYSGLEMSLVGLLMSPEFLLRIEHARPGKGPVTELDAYSKATRLAYFLTDSTPDDELIQAATSGELDHRRGLEKQVDRLIASPKFEAGVRAFFWDMLEFDKFESLAKDPTIYPAFTPDVLRDAQEQTLRTISATLLRDHRDYRDLFTTRDTFLTRALGVIYQVPVATRNGWEEEQFPADSHRAGIQSHISFLALHSHPGRSSPTLRGKAIREIFLCQEVPGPPANVNFALIQDASNKKFPTARDRLTLHRTQPSCMGCHKIMDPIGLTLENFDGAGRFRTTENGAPIDASGDLDGHDFSDVDGVAQALHDHPETPHCLVERMYRYAVGRDTTFDERPYMDYLYGVFERDGYHVPELMRAIALSKNFYAVRRPAPAPAHELASASKTGERK
jgi:hypothetical protein